MIKWLNGGSAVGFLGQISLFEGRCPTPSLSVPYTWSWTRTTCGRQETHPRIAATILDFGFPGSSFSENGSTRGVLIDGTAAAIYSSSNRYILDNMSCARAIDDTVATNNLQQ